MNRSLVRTDHVLRYHLFVCTDSAKFDAFRVELLEQTYVTTYTNTSMDEAWREALDVVSLMRSEYSANPVRHSSVFEPFAIITAVEHARESSKLGVRINKIVGGCHDAGHPVHNERVRALCQALDQIDFLKRRPQVLN